ncbi:unnamed protein product [Dibothriocephalus latus]|uniref:Electron transfer flavoprotein alpha/beta-subunit N-terminal domain-containing protein n=1 Tax=Dibothriocephalus latus TaxID=60516 RepID=A0A3P7PD59_DIBLA|nr:unnamed protein product [Dibothriocephalus latus]
MNLSRALVIPRHFGKCGHRFLSALVVAEHDNSKISSATLSAISAASLIGDVSCLVAGKKCGPIAEYVSSLAGVKKVMLAENAVFEHPIAENYSQLVLACQSSFAATHIIAGTSAFSRSFMPRVAVTLNSSLISDVLAVLSPDTFQRPIYAGNALVTLQSLVSSPPIRLWSIASFFCLAIEITMFLVPDKVHCLTVRETSFVPAEPSNNKAVIEAVDYVIEECNKVKFIKQTIAKKDRPGLNEAKIIISGGRALKSKENFQRFASFCPQHLGDLGARAILIAEAITMLDLCILATELLYTLADKLGAAVGATRAAVDAGFVDNELQVRQPRRFILVN